MNEGGQTPLPESLYTSEFVDEKLKSLRPAVGDLGVHLDQAKLR
jgi:hypothetical protein